MIGWENRTIFKCKHDFNAPWCYVPTGENNVCGVTVIRS